MDKKFQPNPSQLRALNSFIKLLRGTESLSHRVHTHLADANLSLSQFQVLEVLYHLGPLCQRDIAAKVLKTTGNLTMVINNLEKQQLIIREQDETDRRYYLIRLSPQGKKLVDKVFPCHVEILTKEMSVLSGKEIDELGRLCKKIGLGK